jgi:hypothetical protein
MPSALAVTAAVWLWAGVPMATVPAHVDTVYVYQGVIVEQNGAVSVTRRGIQPHGGDQRAIVPVVRFSGQPPADRVAEALEALAADWEARGRTVPMVQIDRDVASSRVGAHADFVAAVRSRLSRRYLLGVTALADWLASANRTDLLRLARAADEIVFQLYHERHEVPGLPRFDAALSRFEAPFKVGLLPDMDVPPASAQSANWRGTIVFLQRSTGSPVP